MSEKNYRLPGFSAAGTGRVPGGFSLVEIMVALVIGMLGIIVMMQVFAMFEAQKRTTTGGDDAISSGSIAFTFDYDGDADGGTAGTDKAVVLIGIRPGSGKFAAATGTLTRSKGISLSLVAEQDRIYA